MSTKNIREALNLCRRQSKAVLRDDHVELVDQALAELNALEATIHPAHSYLLTTERTFTATEVNALLREIASTGFTWRDVTPILEREGLEPMNP